MTDENLTMKEKLQLYTLGAQAMFSSCVLDDTVTIPASSVETTLDAKPTEPEALWQDEGEEQETGNPA